MRYIGYGTTAAAVVGVATLAGLLGFGGRSAAASFQEALDNAEKAKSVRIVFKSGPKGAEDTDVTIYRQGDFARVEDRDGKCPDRRPEGAGSGPALDPDAKTARLVDLTAEEADAAADVYAKYVSPLKTVREAAGATVRGTARREGRRPAPEGVLGSPPRRRRNARPSWPGCGSTRRPPCRSGSSSMRASPRAARRVIQYDRWNAEFDAKLFERKVPAGYQEVKE